MKNIPWKGIAVSCGILTVMVLFRCIITAGRFIYYGGTYWHNEIMQDPWFYIGMAAAALCVASLLVLADRADKERKNEVVDFCV